MSESDVFFASEGSKLQESKTISKRAVLRQAKIIDAALTVILRHGFDRCSMQDIAAESGITRAALYRYFSNKEEVLCALVVSINEKAAKDVLHESSSGRPFRERLFGVLNARLGRIQAILRQSEHGAEISGATHRVTGHLTVSADKAYLNIVQDMFVKAARSGEIDVSVTGMSPEQYAEICVFAAKGLMKEAGDVAYRRDYPDSLRKLCSVVCLSLGLPLHARAK